MKVKPDHEVSPSRPLAHVDRDENDERPRADARSSPKVPDLEIVHCPECGSVEVDNLGDGDRLCCLVCQAAWAPEVAT